MSRVYVRTVWQRNKTLSTRAARNNYLGARGCCRGPGSALLSLWDTDGSQSNLEIRTVPSGYDSCEFTLEACRRYGLPWKRWQKAAIASAQFPVSEVSHRSDTALQFGVQSVYPITTLPRADLLRTTRDPCRLTHAKRCRLCDMPDKDAATQKSRHSWMSALFSSQISGTGFSSSSTTGQSTWTRRWVVIQYRLYICS